MRVQSSNPTEDLEESTNNEKDHPPCSITERVKCLGKHDKAEYDSECDAWAERRKVRPFIVGGSAVRGAGRWFGHMGFNGHIYPRKLTEKMEIKQPKQSNRGVDR